MFGGAGQGTDIAFSATFGCAFCGLDHGQLLLGFLFEHYIPFGKFFFQLSVQSGRFIGEDFLQGCIAYFAAQKLLEVAFGFLGI